MQKVSNRKKTQYRPSKMDKTDLNCIQESHQTEAYRFSCLRLWNLQAKQANWSQKKSPISCWHGITDVLTAQATNGSLQYITMKVYLEGKELLIAKIFQLSTEKHLTVGNLNSHSPARGYFSLKRKEIKDWVTDNRLLLINKPDDKPSSRAWKKISSALCLKWHLEENQ